MTTLEAEKPVKNPLHQHELITQHTIWAADTVGWHTSLPSSLWVNSVTVTVVDRPQVGRRVWLGVRLWDISTTSSEGRVEGVSLDVGGVVACFSFNLSK